DSKDALKRLGASPAKLPGAVSGSETVAFPKRPYVTAVEGAGDNYWPAEWAARGLPAAWDAAKKNSGSEIKLHPRDPRVRIAHADLLYDLARFTEEEQDLRAALADKETLSYSGLDAHVRLRLADLLLNSDRKSEAFEIIAPVCRGPLPG